MTTEQFDFYVSYNIGEKSFSKSFNDLTELRDFLFDLCKVSQTECLFLQVEFRIGKELIEAGQ